MEQPQFNTRVTPDIKDKYNGFMDFYKSNGRITKKGDFFGICLNDHIELEKYRLFMENCNPTTREYIEHLKREFDLLQQMEIDHNNEISLITKKMKDELALKELQISKLEEKIQLFKEELQEKIIENDDLRKGLERLQKKEVRKKA
jgi:hypothetical protein